MQSPPVRSIGAPPPRVMALPPRQSSGGFRALPPGSSSSARGAREPAALRPAGRGPPAWRPEPAQRPDRRRRGPCGGTKERHRAAGISIEMLAVYTDPELLGIRTSLFARGPCSGRAASEPDARFAARSDPSPGRKAAAGVRVGGAPNPTRSRRPAPNRLESERVTRDGAGRRPSHARMRRPHRPPRARGRRRGAARGGAAGRRGGNSLAAPAPRPAGSWGR